jgi:anaerobic selenocysteine-containing dehydrogenase
MLEKIALKAKMNRREFLKLTGATAAVGMLGDTLLGGKRTNPLRKAAEQLSTQDGWYQGVCKMCMQGDCQQRVHVVNGVVMQVVGEERAVQNAGTLCPRGNAAIAQMYNPWRAKAPMKRTNPVKGLNEDPKFVEITWDEAIQAVSDHLKKVLADDPRKVAFVSGFGVNSPLLGSFEKAYGSPNDVPSRGSACAYHIASRQTHSRGPDQVPDLDRVEYILNYGHTLGPNIAASSGSSRHIMNALVDRGVKMVNVDPRCGPEASKMDWVPIKPGTELALNFAILHTILYEIGTFDKWFVKNRTTGPYLIGADGDYVRDPKSKKPLMFDRATYQPVPFDFPRTDNLALEGSYTVNGSKVSPAFQLIKDSVKDYTPEWQEPITTIPAAKVREIANDLITHAHIGATTTIDGVTMPFRPVAILYTSKGPYSHPIAGTWADYVTKFISELLGNLEVPGGATGCSTPGEAWLQPDEDGVRIPNYESGAGFLGYPWSWPLTFADLRQFYPMSHTLVWGLAKNILEPEKYHAAYEIETLMSVGGGPVRSSYDRNLFEKAWSKVPFHVAFPLTMDENAVLADYVLPDMAFLEKDQYVPGSSAPPGHKVSTDETRGSVYFLFRDASAITPAYNARSMDAVLLDIAEKVGVLTGEKGMIAAINAGIPKFPLDTSKKPTMREIAEATLKQNFGADKTLDMVNDEHGPFFKYTVRGAKLFNYYYWPDNKVRHQMYLAENMRARNELQKNLKAAGLDGIPGWETNMDDYWKAYDPIPSWVQCYENSKAPAEYDLYAINWKTPMAPFFCGDTHANVWLHETMKTWDPYEYSVWINSATAAKKGIQDGDMIVIESQWGKTQGQAKVTELIQPDTIGIPSGHGAASPMANPITAEGAYHNGLGNLDEKNLAVDPLTAQIEEGFAVKVYKA